MSEEQVLDLVSQAEEHADDDRNRRGLTELKNKATGLVYSTERTLDEFGADITSDDSEAIRKAVENTSELIASGDYEVLRESVEALSTLSYGMTEKLYAAFGWRRRWLPPRPPPRSKSRKRRSRKSSPRTTPNNRPKAQVPPAVALRDQSMCLESDAVSRRLVDVHMQLSF